MIGWEESLNPGVGPYYGSSQLELGNVGDIITKACVVKGKRRTFKFFSLVSLKIDTLFTFDLKGSLSSVPSLPMQLYLAIQAEMVDYSR